MKPEENEKTVIERQREVYQEERGKLTQLPDSDADFVALHNASERWF